MHRDSYWIGNGMHPVIDVISYVAFVTCITNVIAPIMRPFIRKQDCVFNFSTGM